MIRQHLARPRTLYLLSALASLALSLWYLAIDPVTNNDGTLYLRAAELFVQGKWQSGYSLYHWPFYSLLIAGIHSVSSLEYDNVAYLIGIVLNTASVVLFIAIIRELGGDLRTQWFAAAVILLHPALNDYRSFIIRDTGYITFYLLSVLFLFRYLKMPKWHLLSGWVLAGILAAAFRIEGFIILFGVAIFLYLRNSSGRSAALKLAATGAAVLVGATLIVMIWRGQFFAIPHGDIYTFLLDMPSYAWNHLSAGIGVHIAALRDVLQNSYSAEYALPLYIAAVLIIFVSETIKRLTILYGLLVGHAWQKKLLFPKMELKTIWLWLLILHAAILLVFSSLYLFLSGRFPLALSLTLLMAVPFSLSWIHEHWLAKRAASWRSNWVFPATAILITLVGISQLNAFTAKHHLKDAGIWLHANMGTTDRLFSNNQIVAYYVRRDYATITLITDPGLTMSSLAGDNWKQYDFVAIYIKRDQKAREAALRKLLPMPPIHSLHNRKGGSVLIFSTHSSARNNNTKK